MTLLICDDDKQFRNELKALTTALGFETLTFSTPQALHEGLKAHASPTAILLDLVLPECDGVQVLRQILALNLPVIALTSAKNEEAGLHAVHLGAQDYLVKPLNPARVEVALRHLTFRAASPAPSPFIAASPRLKSLLINAQKAFLTPSPLLIEGDKGTGKSLFVQELVRTSERASQGFTLLEAAALTETALDAAFAKPIPTTLILDNGEKLPPACQNLLKQLLVKKKHKLLFIAGKPLLGQVQQGKFDAALYYQLAIHPFSLPIFRADLLDFNAIATQFHTQALSEFGGESLHFALENLLHNHLIKDYHALKKAITQSLLLETMPHLILFNANGFRPLVELEAEIYASALRESNGQMSEIARKLGIGRTTLYRKLIEFGLVHPMKQAA